MVTRRIWPGDAHHKRELVALIRMVKKLTTEVAEISEGNLWDLPVLRGEKITALGVMPGQDPEGMMV